MTYVHAHDPLVLAELVRKHKKAADAASGETRLAELQSMRRLQNVLARRFGEERGWIWAEDEPGIAFGLRDLAEGAMRGWSSEWRRNPSPDSYEHQFTHPYCYRRDGHAAAIAAHLCPTFLYHHTSCSILAREYNLHFEVPAYPSWWCPDLGNYGGTTLVVYIGPEGLNTEYYQKQRIEQDRPRSPAMDALRQRLAARARAGTSTRV